jgi:hypothetical protein
MDTRSSAATSWFRRHIQRDPIEQVIELAFTQFDSFAIWQRALGYTEHVPVQAFVELAKPGAVEEQNLQRALSLPEEHKQRAAASCAADTFFNQSAQPVKSPSQINGLEADEDLDTARDHERSPHAVAANASNTTDSASRSASAPTSTRACPTCTMMGAVLGAGRALRFRTTRASRTVFFGSEALPARFK